MKEQLSKSNSEREDIKINYLLAHTSLIDHNHKD
jgi:hypothetical protein